MQAWCATEPVLHIHSSSPLPSPTRPQVFNLSERSYDTSKFNNQVLDFGWPDHLAPSLERLSRWVQWAGQSVIARDNSQCPAVHNASEVLEIGWCMVFLCVVCASP